MDETPRYSIVILTFDRPDSLRMLLGELSKLTTPRLEVIVVDNCPDKPATNVIRDFSFVKLVSATKNLGAEGRNLGLAVAQAEIVVCLDDDVSGLTDAGLAALDPVFEEPNIGAVNFKVIEYGTWELTNWVHHCDADPYSERVFETYEITEGAVAFRRSALLKSGYYPEGFFLSHEGPDLAFRIIDAGYRVIYSPATQVIHAYSPRGRTAWRNYYYDTRNTTWMVVRNLPFWYGTRTLLRQTLAMFVYAARDRFLIWWARGLIDSIRGLPTAWRQRKKISRAAMRYIKQIDSNRPSLLSLIRRRLFQTRIKL
jgi:GT2 family glycosyltransferase